MAEVTASSTADDLLRALSGPEFRADPYPLYRQLREIAPLHRCGLDGLWYASRYEDCRQVLAHPRCGHQWDSSRFLGLREEGTERFNRWQRTSLFGQNPPEHTRLRGLVSRVFAHRQVQELGPRIVEFLEPMLDKIAQAGEADVMADLAYPLSVAMIGELVGVPAGEREAFRVLVRDSQTGAEAYAPPETVAAAERANAFMEAYFVDLVARRRAKPADDLLSGLIAVHDSGGWLSEEEVVSTAVLLFLAGFATTSYLIGNGLLALLRHPGEFDRLWNDPSLVPSAVEEMLRWDASIQGNFRTVFQPIELGGQVIQAGETVIALLGAANRDPARFPDSERFDVGRADNPHLSFGVGIRHCLGASLARLEGQIVFSRFIERFRRVELADDDPPWTASSKLRGLDALPVRLQPR
ncbi:MAG: cytochrome P450 [Egibacteraceae bacterium]